MNEDKQGNEETSSKAASKQRAKTQGNRSGKKVHLLLFVALIDLWPCAVVSLVLSKTDQLRRVYGSWTHRVHSFICCIFSRWSGVMVGLGYEHQWIPTPGHVYPHMRRSYGSRFDTGKFGFKPHVHQACATSFHESLIITFTVCFGTFICCNSSRCLGLLWVPATIICGFSPLAVFILTCNVIPKTDPVTVVDG